MQSSNEQPVMPAANYIRNKTTSIIKAGQKLFNPPQCHSFPDDVGNYKAEPIQRDALFRLGWHSLSRDDSTHPECMHWLVPKDMLHEISTSLKETISFLTVENDRLRQQVAYLGSIVNAKQAARGRGPKTTLLPPPFKLPLGSGPDKNPAQDQESQQTLRRQAQNDVADLHDHGIETELLQELDEAKAGEEYKLKPYYGL